jgi:hypothetical protein
MKLNEMKTSPRFTTTVLLLSFLCGCASSGMVKIVPPDRREIQRVAVLQKHNSISTDFSLPTHPVSGALRGVGAGLVGGLVVGALAGGPFGAAAAAGILVPLGLWSGAVCGAAVADAELENPADEFRRIGQSVKAENFRRALVERLQELRPSPPDSSAPSRADAMLEIFEVNINVTGDLPHCAPTLSGSAKWRALRSADNKVLGAVTTKWSRRAASETFKQWLRNEDAVRTDLGLLLDELGIAIADELLTGKTSTPN